MQACLSLWMQSRCWVVWAWNLGHLQGVRGLPYSSPPHPPRFLRVKARGEQALQGDLRRPRHQAPYMALERGTHTSGL